MKNTIITNTKRQLLMLCAALCCAVMWGANPTAPDMSAVNETSYQLTVNSGANGVTSVTYFVDSTDEIPETGDTRQYSVIEGVEVSFTFTPSSEYSVGSVTVDGVDVTASLQPGMTSPTVKTYTLAPMSADVTVQVTYAKNYAVAEPYIVLDSGDKLTMTYYYDTYKSSHTSGYVVDFENRMSDNVYTNNRDYVEEIYIDSTFVNYPLTTANALFSNFTALTAIYGLENLNTSNVEDMYAMFAVCSKLTSIDVSGLNTANVKYMGSMFEECTSLTTLDLSNFNTANVTKMSYMFYHCSSLTTIYVSSLWSTANVTSTNGATLFTGCNNLVGGAGTTYDEEHQNVDYAHIDGGPDNPGYLTSSGETPNVVAPEAYAVLSGDNTTLTFYYDDQKVARNGMDIGPFAYLEHGFGESQRPWHDVRESITDVVFDSSMANDTTLISTGWWFYGCTNLKRTSGWQYLPTANIVDMWGMFENCSSLSSNPVEGGPDFSAFNTASLKRTCYLFHGCTSMTSIDLSTFNTANVTETEGMFKDCAALTTIYVGSGWTMTNVSGNWEDDMFSGSTSLVGGAGTTYDASNIGVSYAHIDGGPDNPGYLTSNGDTPYVVASEAYAVLSDDDVVLSQSATNITYGKKLTFYYDKKKSERYGMSVGPFESAGDRGWNANASSVTSVVFDDSFAGYTGLTSTAYWFRWCDNLSSILGIDNLKTDNVTDMREMFHACASLTSINVSGFNTANVTNMSGMFSECTKLTSLDISNFNTEKVTDMSTMFAHNSMTSINLGNLNTSNVTLMNGMFDGCDGLTSLDLSSFNTKNVTDMSYMFWNCQGLSTLDLSNFNTENVTDMSCMFWECDELSTLDLSSFNTENVTAMRAMFYSCNSLTNINLSSFNTPNLINTNQMFGVCNNLTSLNLGSFKTDNVTDMGEMFYDCLRLETIYVGSGWSTAAVTNSDGMFAECTNLVGGMGTTYDENHVDVSYAHIDGGASNPGYFTPKSGYVEAPTFAWSGDELSMTTGTEGATIYYLLTDANSGGTSTPTQYTAPVAVKSDVLIEAYAEKDGMARSMTTVLDYPYSAWMQLVTAIADAQNVLAQATTNDNVTAEQRDSLVNFINTAQGMYEARIDSATAITQFTTDLTTLTETVRQAVEAVAEPYAVLSDNGTFVDPETGDEITAKTLTFYYDKKKADRNGMSVGPFDKSSERWGDYLSDIISVVFDDSFSNCMTLTSTAYWFRGCNNLASISGLNNLKTGNVTNMSDMFCMCSGLTSLDLSGFNTTNVTNMYQLFWHCSNLTTLYCGNEWTTDAVTNGNSMFAGCTNLVGGAGTTYDASHVDKTYAHIDGGTSNPGYLTDINAPLDTVATPTFSLSGDDLVISTTTEGATINYTISDRQNYYLVGGNGEWGSDKSQKFTLTGYVGGLPAIYSYVLTGTGSDLWFAFGDTEALDAIDNGYWSQLYGTKGSNEDLTGSFDRRTNLGADGSFHVDGTSPYYKFTINMVDMTYEITPLDSHPGIVPAGDSLFTYTQPIPLDRDMVIKATATKTGMNDSETATLDYPFSTWLQLISMRSTSQTAVNTYANRTEVAELVEQLKALMVQADNMYANQRLTATADEILNLYNQMLDVYVSIENILRNRSTELAVSDKYYIVGEVNHWMPESAIQNMFYRDANGNFTYTTDWGATQWALKVWDTRGIGDWTSAWGTTVDGCQDESGVLTSINTVSNGAFAPPAWSDSTGVNYCTLTFNAKTHEYMWTHLDDQQPTEYQTVGIVGDFNGWGNDVEMTQVAPHNWYIRYTFPQRTSFKLRANNAWDANWGYGVQTTRSYYCINGINGANIGAEADEYDIYLNDITGQINMVPTREFSVQTAEDVEITMYKSADVATQCSLRGGLGYYSMSNAQYNNAGDMLVNTPNAPAVLPDTEGNVTIPAEANGYSVVAIPAYAFNGTKISGITLPAGIVDYQDNAFAGCASLDTVISLRQSPVAIPDSTFSMAHYEHAVLFVPEGSIDAYKATDGWKNFSNIYEIGTVIPDPEAYAVLSGDSITLTFYYDKQKEQRGGMDIGEWDEAAKSTTMVVVDASFASYHPTSTVAWFAGLTKLASIEGMSNLKTDSVTNMWNMFGDCISLMSIDLSGLKTDKVENMGDMFGRCSGLTSLDVSNLNTENVNNMQGMFAGCKSLMTLDLSGFKTDNVSSMYSMFSECSSLKTIYVGDGWSTANNPSSEYMFAGCTSLVGGMGTVFDENHVDATYAHIDGGPSNPGYFTLPLSMGDANGDGNINIADAVATVTNILGQPTEAAFYKYAADMNTDQVIDIFDVTLIVNAAFDAASPAPAMTRGSASNIMMEHISMTADADYIYLGIDQPERFTATQFDVTLPEGMELVDARLASASTDHQLSFVKRGDNEYRVIGLSMSNTTFRSMNGQLIKLEVSGSAVDSDVKMSNVLFVTPTATVMTSIDKCLNTAKMADDSLYDLKGQRLSNQQLGKGIYIMNHKKVIIK